MIHNSIFALVPFLYLQICLSSIWQHNELFNDSYWILKRKSYEAFPSVMLASFSLFTTIAFKII
jgi:hypothetical protein